MSDRVVTRNDQGRTITVQTGDAIVLRIEENLSTGYSWDIAAESGPVLALQHSEHVAATGGLMGCSGMRLLHFVAQAAGRVGLLLPKGAFALYAAFKLGIGLGFCLRHGLGGHAVCFFFGSSQFLTILIFAVPGSFKENFLFLFLNRQVYLVFL